MRYWLYKCNVDGGPAGFWGDWRTMVFDRRGPVGWGGHYSTRSAEVARYIDTEVSVGDVVVAYQTNEREIVGFCVVQALRVSKKHGGTELYLQPIEALDPGLPIHEVKHGTPLANSTAVNGPVMLRELSKPEVQAIVRLSGAPSRVLRGQPPKGGWKPPRRTRSYS